nr:hypothetical protein [Tanacetum cinerariifolium]
MRVDEKKLQGSRSNLRNNKWYQSLLRSFEHKKNNTEVPTEFALMAKSSSSFENEVFNDSLCSESCKKNTDSLNTKITNLNEAVSESKTNLYHYKLGLSQAEARLVEFKSQEIKFCEKIRGLEFDVKNKNTKIENLMNELEQIKKEKEGLDSKLTGFESAFKDLDILLGSQRFDKNKEVPEFADDTITDYNRPSPSKESNSSDLQNSNSSVSEHGESSESIISKPMIKFVKAADCAKVKTNKAEAARKPSIKYAKMYRNSSKSPKVRDSLFQGKSVVRTQFRVPKVWKPVKPNSASIILRRYDYVDASGRSRVTITLSFKVVDPILGTIIPNHVITITHNLCYMIITEFDHTQKFNYEVGELRAVSGHVLGAARVQILKNNLDNLHLTVEEDGTLEIIDPQDLLDSLLSAMIY